MASTYYLIARAGRQAELQAYRAALEAHGHVVTNRTLHLVSVLTTWHQSALNHIADLQAADRVLIFSDPAEVEPEDGEHWVEAGFALWTLLAAPGRIHVHLIGPEENIFCSLVPHRWENFEAYLAWQQGQDAGEGGN